MNVVTGNFTPSFTDLSVAGLGVTTDFQRTYNSQFPLSGPFGSFGSFGPGWAFSYGMSVTSVSGAVYVTYGSGRVQRFVLNANGSYTPPPGNYDTLTGTAEGFTLKRRDQVAYDFNQSGELTSITDPNGNTTTLKYTAGELTGITDAAGRGYALYHNHNGEIIRITGPDGVAMEYGYDAGGNLVRSR